MRLAPPTLSVAHHPNFSGGHCLGPSWHLPPVREGFPFLLSSPDVVIDDDGLLTRTNHRPGWGGMTFRSLTLMTGSIARIFLNVVSHSDHPVNLDKTMREENMKGLLCDVAKDATR